MREDTETRPAVPAESDAGLEDTLIKEKEESDPAALATSDAGLEKPLIGEKEKSEPAVLAIPDAGREKPLIGEREETEPAVLVIPDAGLKKPLIGENEKSEPAVLAIPDAGLEKSLIGQNEESEPAVLTIPDAGLEKSLIGEKEETEPAVLATSDAGLGNPLQKGKKLLFVFNPKSGKGQIRLRLMEIIDLFVKEGYEVTAHPTQGPEDAQQLIPRAAPYFDRIVCSGGDGTLDEVVNGLIACGSDIPVGYIPAGSTNDFAHSLKLPRKMLQAAETAATGTPFPCDVGEFNRNYFIYIAAFGLFTDVSYQTSQKLKNIFGYVAYVLESAKHLYDIPSYVLDVEVNGRRIRDEFVYGMVSNSTSVGGLKNMTGKNVKLDDGLFEVTLIRMPQNPIQLNDILTSLLMPKLAESPYIYSFKTNHITMSCEDYVPWTLDGEFGGRHRDVVIDNHCRRITFLI